MTQEGSTHSKNVIDDAASADRRGLMFVLSSPSGAGKSTIANLLLDEFPDLKLSVSATTRPRRSNEVDGKHYHFLDRAGFDKMVERDELLEWAEVHGNCYGTPSDFVEQELSSGQDVLFDIDVQGTSQLRQKRPDDVATVFILPPSINEMKARLKRRAADSDEVIQRRMKTAVGELERWAEYDYLVVNEDLESAFKAVKAILISERHKKGRQSGNASLTKTLHADLVKQTKGED